MSKTFGCRVFVTRIVPSSVVRQTCMTDKQCCGLIVRSTDGRDGYVTRRKAFLATSFLFRFRFVAFLFFGFRRRKIPSPSASRHTKTTHTRKTRHAGHKTSATATRPTTTRIARRQGTATKGRKIFEDERRRTRSGVQEQRHRCRR